MSKGSSKWAGHAGAGPSRPIYQSTDWSQLTNGLVKMKASRLLDIGQVYRSTLLSNNQSTNICVATDNNLQSQYQQGAKLEIVGVNRSEQSRLGVGNSRGWVLELVLHMVRGFIERVDS